MKYILLGGQSIKNKEWIEEVNTTLQKNGFDSQILYYSHWETGKKEADVPKETDKLVQLIGSLNDDYCIFAKSIGTVITLTALKQLPALPKAAVFVGVPLHMANSLGYNFAELYNFSSVPIHIYQKEHDPYASYEDLRSLRGKNILVQLYAGKGEDNDNHHYSNTEMLMEIMRSTTGN